MRPVGGAAHEDLDGLVERLVNAAGGDGRWGLVIAGRRAFAPPRGRLELAAAEHVRSVVRERFSGGGGKRGGKRWLLGQGVLICSVARGRGCVRACGHARALHYSAATRWMLDLLIEFDAPPEPSGGS